jgi:hypothetical protein
MKSAVFGAKGEKEKARCSPLKVRPEKSGTPNLLGEVLKSGGFGAGTQRR